MMRSKKKRLARAKLKAQCEALVVMLDKTIEVTKQLNAKLDVAIQRMKETP